MSPQEPVTSAFCITRTILSDGKFSPEQGVEVFPEPFFVLYGKVGIYFDRHPRLLPFRTIGTSGMCIFSCLIIARLSVTVRGRTLLWARLRITLLLICVGWSRGSGAVRECCEK